MTSRAAVIGAGSWGTALGNLLAGKGIDTVVWSYEPDVADSINREHVNRKYLDGIELAPSMHATPDMAEAVRGADLVLSVSPSHVVRQVMAQAAEHMEEGALLVSASKGIENDSLKTMDGVLADVLPERAACTFFAGGRYGCSRSARALPVSCGSC